MRRIRERYKGGKKGKRMKLREVNSKEARLNKMNRGDLKRRKKGKIEVK